MQERNSTNSADQSDTNIQTKWCIQKDLQVSGLVTWMDSGDIT